MSVWLTIPSARPPAEVDRVMEKWRAQGYKIALWRDDHPPIADWWNTGEANFIHSEKPYPGYAKAVNRLIATVMREDPGAEWFIIGGDDTLPDPDHTADEIAAELNAFFHGINANLGVEPTHCHLVDTFGVCQPTGDRWHEGVGGFTNAPIDRVAGSAWIGREFARRAYGGNGPLFPGYQHMYVDEELQAVAEKLGVFWQRRDLVQKHMHWGRGETDAAVVSDPIIPGHLVKWNTSKHWQESKLLFQTRKAAGFPGHEPL